MSDEHVHQSHPDIVKRLKRGEGHVRSIIQMIETQRPCLDIAQQMHAVERAVGQAKKALIQDHLDHCMEHVAGSMTRDRRQSIDEFKEITKSL